MKQTARIALVALLATAMTATSAMACGESLFRVGKGKHYREYIAPIPGNILLVGKTEAARVAAEVLSRAGHTVQLVDETADISALLKSGRIDIVMARFKEREAVEAERADAGSQVKYIPVAEEKTEESAAKALYQQTILTTSSDKDMLKAIHRTLKMKT